MTWIGSAALESALMGGSVKFWYEGDLWYDGERRLTNLPLKDTKLSDSDSRAVKTQGSTRIVWSDSIGSSILPREIGDVFSPFGSELALYARVQVGSFTERVSMGWFQIVDVPEMRDQTMYWGGRTITTGSSLTLQLMDRYVQITGDEFDAPTAPVDLTSVWSEIGRITGLQLVRAIADAPISRSVAYKNAVHDAVGDLADILGGTPFITRDGALSMRPKLWPGPVKEMRRGEHGTIVDIAKGMSSSGVYNKVVFRGQGDLQDQVLAISEVRSGPLRTQNPDGTRSPAYKRPTFRSNDFVSTLEQAQAYTDAELVRVRTLNAVPWELTTFWDPRDELGDVWSVSDEHDETTLVRVVAITRDGGATQKVTVARG
jgi:hypothetical protein